MSFVPPTASQALHLKVRAAFGFTIADDPGTWVFTDITKWSRPGLQPVTLSGGRSSLSSTADPAQISLTLDNTDGRFTARNPSSPYFPNVKRNTPIQVAITWDGATDPPYELLTTFVNGWPLTPLAGVLSVSTPITASGRLYRLRRSNKTLRSALRRFLTGGNKPDGYWPMEDASGATQFEAVAGLATRVSNQQLAASTAVPGSAALPDWSAGDDRMFLTGSMSTTHRWTAGFALQVGQSRGTTTGLVQLAQVYISTGESWQLYLSLSSNRWRVDYTDPTGAVTVNQLIAPFTGTNTFNGLPGIDAFDGQPHWIVLTGEGIGSPLVHLYIDGQEVDNAPLGATVFNNATAVRMGGSVTTFPLIMGHLAVLNDLGIGQGTDAMLGYAGELATDRVIRFCAELGIPATVNVGDVPAQTMGPQPVTTASGVLDECADIDNGLLHDAGPNGNLVYTSGAARYNAAVSMTLNYLTHQIGDGLASTYDDQDLVTEWTISRTGGSSATVDDPDATDDYAQQDTVNAWLDNQLDDIASWRVHEGTYDAYRLPSISINMRKTPELAQASLALELPARISPTNLPTPYPSESLDQFAEGFTTVVDSVSWTTTYSCQPYGPWQVGVWDTSRYDSASSTLATGITATGTTLSVATTNTLDLWTTASGDRPFTIIVDFEVMTVTNLTGASSPQTFTVTRATNGIHQTHSAGAEVHIYPPAVVAL